MEEKFCTKYKMDCDDIEDECIIWIGGLGFKGWECELKCDECEHMEIY